MVYGVAKLRELQFEFRCEMTPSRILYGSHGVSAVFLQIMPTAHQIFQLTCTDLDCANSTRPYTIGLCGSGKADSLSSVKERKLRNQGWDARILLT